MNEADMERNCLVSVAMAVFNGQDCVAEAIRSVLSQTHRNTEVVVVDDGSTDETWDVLQSFGSAIRPIRQANGGLAEARNTAIREARGDFVALMDHDDVCEPERLAVQLKFLQQQPALMLCGSDFSAFRATGTVAASHIASYYSRCSEAAGGIAARYPQHGRLDVAACLVEEAAAPVWVSTHFGNVYDELALGNFIHPPTVMFRRSAIEVAGCFDPAALSMCDWDWLVRAAACGPVGHVHRPLLRYRLSATQLSSSARAAADSLHVAERICTRDPSLLQRHPVAFRRLLGEMHADAAYGCSTTDRRLALSLLVASAVRHGHWTPDTLRTLLRVVLPDGLRRALRSAAAAGGGKP